MGWSLKLVVHLIGLKNVTAAKLKVFFPVVVPTDLATQPPIGDGTATVKNTFMVTVIVPLPKQTVLMTFPIFSTLAQTARHDSVSLIYSLYRIKLLFSQFNFTSAILDSAHDNYDRYELLKHWNIEPFI